MERLWIKPERRWIEAEIVSEDTELHTPSLDPQALSFTLRIFVGNLTL